MKKFYMNPELVVIALNMADIVTSSTSQLEPDDSPAGKDHVWGDSSNFPFVNEG